MIVFGSESGIFLWRCFIQ